MGPQDAEIVERWLGGDPRGFEALVRRWQAPVARLLGRLVGRGGPVPDLCQEVFLRVYRARDRYRENGAFAVWLYRIAVNVARDAGRRRRHEPAPLGGHEPVDPAAPADRASENQE